MRCDEVRESVEELRGDALPAPLREHLVSCAACAAYARQWQLVEAGLRALAREPVPAASLGFAARVVRRLEGLAEAGRKSEELWERAGRRFVFATLLLALTTLLVLLLPSSGPLRAPTTTEAYFAGLEVAATANDPLFADEASSDFAPGRSGPTEGSSAKPR